MIGNQNKKTISMIEILEIRLARNLNELLEKEIEQIMSDVKMESAGITIKLFQKSNLNSDYLIIIMNSSGMSEKQCTELGQRIKAALSEYGLINHSKWNEIVPVK
jgi:hypothetical protein